MAFVKQWWFDDPSGARIGWMHPVEFDAHLAHLFPGPGAPRRFAEFAGYTKAIVYRWCKGTVPVPRHVALLVATLMERGHVRGIGLDAPWLPDPDTGRRPRLTGMLAHYETRPVGPDGYAEAESPGHGGRDGEHPPN